MKRIITGVAALVCAALLFGCGGGGASAPAPGGDTGGAKVNPLRLAPAQGTKYSADGDMSVSNLPGQFSFATGSDKSKLTALVGPLGFTVVSVSHNRAIVQAPSGMDAAEAQNTLDKQYLIADVEPVQELHTISPHKASPWINYDPKQHGSRNVSFTPLDPWFSDRFAAFAGLDQTTSKPQFLNWFGQGMPLEFMGFNGAWDVANNPTIESQPVKIAIIDAGWFDYSTVDRDDLNEANQLDAANSGSVDGGGTFTAGLAAAKWDTVDDDANAATPEKPLRDTGEVMLGILAAGDNTFTPIGNDWDTSGTVDSDEVWNEGIAGINPSSGATYILIKTGSASVNSWTFTDAQIAASIDHAVSSGANIILLGMFANGTPSAQLQTSITAARTAGVEVIAPAGDVVSTVTFDDTTGNVTGFGSAANDDIQATKVTPASATGLLSVCMTGYNRFPGLPDFDAGPPIVPNIGIGYSPVLAAPLDPNFGTVLPFSNKNADIAAVGYAIGFGFHPLLTQNSGADLFPAENMFSVITLTGGTFATPVFNFSTSFAAAYVAGAASQVYQIWSQVKGTPPTPDELEGELLSTTQFQGTTGVFGTNGTDGGVLNAGAAATSAINGGSLNNTVPALQFTSVIVSQALDAVTRGTDVSITPTIVNGTAPFTLTVDWGDGNPPVVVNNWASAAPVTLTGGYSTLGPKSVNVTLKDANNLSLGVGASLFVINPISCNITISDALGAPVAANAVQVGTQYRLSANPTNVFTGKINGVPNNTVFNWNLDADPAFEATGPNPTFTFAAPGAVTIHCVATEDVRPGGDFTLAITVN